jgi:succinate-semialdehyde dehydrogenase/glutarate-semialdehyde dehydrogenase
MNSINPFTGKQIAGYNEFSLQEIKETIEVLHFGFLNWRKKKLNDRCLINSRLAVLLTENKEQLATLITSEMGKPIAESMAEIEKCAWLCRHYSDPVTLGIEPITIKTDASQSTVRFEPLGVIFAIMPWNFPFWQVFRFAVPSISAGNTVILKHAQNVTGCALAIENLFKQAVPDSHVFKTVVLQASRTEEIISHPYIKGVTITGSEHAGKTVAGLAGKHLKKVVLELGGSDPLIVFGDADLKKCCVAALKSRMLNAGQVCIAAKRFIVHSSIYNQFIEEMTLAISKLKLGDPMDSETNIGPLARPEFVDEIEEKVNKSVEMGARIITGGYRDKDHRGIYMPTLMTDIQDNMPVFCEETFGPVGVVIPFNTDEEAIQIANNTRFGLGASIWTEDIEKAKRVSSELESGCVFINSMVKSDPRLPFGGIKNSGFGRELTTFGVHEFMNIKTEWID